MRTWDVASKLGVSKEIDIERAARVGDTIAPGSTSTAYVGFRAPLVPPKSGGKALIVPNFDRIVSSGTKAAFGTPIELDLGGLTIRDIRGNAANQYLS